MYAPFTHTGLQKGPRRDRTRALGILSHEWRRDPVRSFLQLDRTSPMPSSSPTARPTKSALRQRFRDVRASLTPADYETASADICRRARRLPAVRAADRIHTYWPMVEDQEVDTRPLIQSLAADGVELVLPVVTRYPPAEPEMEHRLFTGLETLQRNRWGIPEPIGTPRVSPDTVDAVIVPALGAGRDGHRIGHGTGYYDAFLRPLAEAGTPLIALVYHDCLVSSVPTDAHDVPVSVVVTDRETVRCRSSNT